MKIIKTETLSLLGVSHHPEILKKVFVEKGTISHLMMFGEATFKPGDAVDLHAHETMTEIFYITTGKAIFEIEGNVTEVEKGDCVVIEAGEKHLQKNESDSDVVWLYFGISQE
jgi:quercetin dioxygenase-like cupin family protein